MTVNPFVCVNPVPGSGGSQLDAKLDKPSVVHYFCEQKTADYSTLWLALSDLVPFVIDCWVDNMKLDYNNLSRTTSNSPGVNIRVPGFGDTQSIEFVDPAKLSVTGYFNVLVNTLLDLGYSRGLDLHGAPYDFRKAPSKLIPS